MDKREAGRLGNRAARGKDPEHQSKAGRKGILALAAIHFGGSVKEAMAWVRGHAIDSQIEALADIRLDAEMAKGRAVAVIELPAMEDYEPESWRERVGAPEIGHGRGLRR